MTEARDIAAAANLAGKTILVTGASSGIGAETAYALAMTGADLILTARDCSAGKAVLDELRQLGTGSHTLISLDLSDPASIIEFAEQVRARASAIDVLIANAGVSLTPQDRLANGFDVRFATNYLGHFILIHRLLDRLRAHGSRIVMLGSAGHKGRPANLDDPAWLNRDIDQSVAYGESKSAVSLFAVEATRRWHGDGIFANCVFPGSVVTGLMRHYNPERLKQMLSTGGAGTGDSVWGNVGECAATSVWAAVAPELDRVGGLVLEDCGLCRISSADSHPWRGYELHSTDSETARRLWLATLSLVERAGIDLGVS